MLTPKVGEDLAAYLNSKTLNEIAAAVNAVLMRSGSGKGYFENAFQNGEILVDLPDTGTADIYSVVILGESLAANIFSDMRPVFSGSVAESQYVFNSSNKIAVLTESPVSGSLTAARFAGIVPAMVKIGPDGGNEFVQPAADGSAEMVTTTQNTGIRILWMNPEATADTAKICMIFLSGVTVPKQEYSGPFKIDLVYADGVPESVTVAGGTITAYNNKGTKAIEIPDFSTSYSGGEISFYITGEPDGSAAAIVAAAEATENTVAYIGSVTEITEGEQTIYNINQSLKSEVTKSKMKQIRNRSLNMP